VFRQTESHLLRSRNDDHVGGKRCQLSRRFYLKNAYEVAGILEEDYVDGHGTYLFRKGL
jgi:hypothetical protein